MPRVTVYNRLGQVIATEDTRTLAEAKQLKLRDLREYARGLVEAMVPDPDGDGMLSRAEAAMLMSRLLNAAAPAKARLEAIRTNLDTHTSAIKALATIANVDAYDFSTGWPA